jgi:hypothetical protein
LRINTNLRILLKLIIFRDRKASQAYLGCLGQMVLLVDKEIPEVQAPKATQDLKVFQ